MSDAVGQIAEAIASANSVVALTGAGVSVPSGIPDFRTPGTGVWEHVNPMEVAHIDVWRKDPRRFWHFYGDRFQTLGAKVPNPGHDALAAMEAAGLLTAVVTQNIDTLHRRAGTQRLVEVHGSIDTSSCLACGHGYDLDVVRDRVAGAADGVPACDCGAPLKPDVVLFGEYLPEGALEEAYSLAAAADVLLCIGTSLEVQPIAQLPGVTQRAGGQVAIITAGPTPWDGRAFARLGGEIDVELHALAAALGVAGDAPLDRRITEASGSVAVDVLAS